MQTLQTVALLSLEFFRTEWDDVAPPTHVSYTMIKQTPVGRLKATKTIDFLTYKASAADQMDGEMFFTLGEQLNREEMNRVLEMGANTQFGEKQAVCAA